MTTCRRCITQWRSTVAYPPSKNSSEKIIGVTHQIVRHPIVVRPGGFAERSKPPLRRTIGAAALDCKSPNTLATNQTGIIIESVMDATVHPRDSGFGSHCLKFGFVIGENIG